MTKKELLKMIRESTLKARYEDLYNTYYTRIEDMLAFCSDNAKLDGLLFIEELGGKGDKDSFELFIGSNSKDRIEALLVGAVRDIKTYGKNCGIIDGKGEKDSVAETMKVAHEWLGAHHKKHFAWSIVFIVGLAAFAALAFIFSILDNLGIWGTDGLASGICGSLDFLFGISFFIYEFLSDKSVKTMYNDMGDATGNAGVIIYKSKIKTGDNANFGVRIGGRSDNDDGGDKADIEKMNSFITKYSKIKTGDNANFGYEDKRK